MRRVWLTACLLAAAAPAWSHPLQPFPETAFKPTVVDGEHIPEVRAAWNLPGYGNLFDIHRRADDVDVYDYAGALCWRDPLASGADANNLVGYYARSWRRFDTAFANAPDGRQFHAQWLPWVPAQCTRKADRTSLLYTFDAITSSFVEFYPYAAERQIDLAQRRAALRPRARTATTDAQLKDIMDEFLQGLEDPHTGINGKVGDTPFALGSQPGKPSYRHLRSLHADSGSSDDFFVWMALDWQPQDYRRVASLFDPARTNGTDLDGFLIWGVLRGSNVGYLSIAQMMGYSSDGQLATERALAGKAIDAALAALQDTDALIVDVSTNLGGYAEVAADFAARFADQRRLAFTTAAPGAHGVAPQPFYVAPAGQSHYDKPVLLLTSDLTVSAGEKFTLMMRALPQVRHVGQATQGALNGGLGKGLPNGWEFGMPSDVLRDPQGLVHEARGITPAIEFEVFPADDFDDGHVHAIRQAAQLAGAP